DPVTGHFHWLARFVIQPRAIRLGGELENVCRKPVLVAAPLLRLDRFGGREVPFADVSGAIPGIPELRGKVWQRWIERNPVSPRAGRCCEHPGLQAGTRWRAYGLA